MTCNHEAPSVEEVATAFADKVPVIGIAWAGSDEEMQGFVDKHGLTFPNANDDPGELYEKFQVPGQPAWVFIDAAGTVTTHLGAMEPEELTSTLDDLARST